MSENLFGQILAARKVASTGSATIFGVEIGLVTNVKDPQQLGRVKVCFPRLNGMPESDWARVVQPAAGPGRGFYWLPEVNDEVLVAFEMGQPNRPYVLRALWNAKDKPMKNAYASDNSVRMIQTKSGHQIAFYDKQGDEKIIISDKTGKRVLTFDAKSKKLLIEADEGDIELRAKKKIVLHCEDLEVKTSKTTKLDVKSTFDLKIASDASIQSGQTATLKGSQVQLNPTQLNAASLGSCNVCSGGGGSSQQAASGGAAASGGGAPAGGGAGGSAAPSGGAASGAPAPSAGPPPAPAIVPTQTVAPIPASAPAAVPPNAAAPQPSSTAAPPAAPSNGSTAQPAAAPQQQSPTPAPSNGSSPVPAGAPQQAASTSPQQSGAAPANTSPLTPMTLSSKGLNFIKKYEGYSNTVYNDVAGNPTIGYGHLIKSNENFSNGITEPQASALLAQDVNTAEKAVNQKVTASLSQTQFDALVDFTYNLGAANLGKSTLLAKLNAGTQVTKENFTDWNRAGGQVVQGLTDRRAAEYKLFMNGDYEPP